MARRARLARVVAALALGVAACRSAPRPASARAAPQAAPPAAPDDPAAPLLRAGMAAWEGRAEEPARLDQAIQLLEEGAARARPAVAGLAWLDAAWARRARGLRVLRAEGEVDAAAARRDGETCLRDVAAARAAGAPPGLPARDPTAEALYLEAVCTADLARLSGFTELGARAPALEPALREVAARAPDLDGAGASRELGLLLAALPAAAGGDLVRARAELDRALSRAPGDARNRLALARAVAVKAQDRALFEDQLRKVAGGADRESAREAEALLQREDDLFGPAQAAQPVPGGPQH